MSPSDFGHQKWGPRGGPGGGPRGGPGGAKKGSPGGGPVFCNFCKFLQPIRRPHFFKISRRPPPGPCPPRGGTPRGGGVRGVPDPQKSTFLAEPSRVGAKNGHFSALPRGGGGTCYFWASREPKNRDFWPPAPKRCAPPLLELFVSFFKVSCIFIEVFCIFSKYLEF